MKIFAGGKRINDIGGMKMNKHNESQKKKPFKLVLLLVVVAAIIFVALHRDSISIDAILAKTMEKPWLTAGVIFLLYAVKGITLVIPLVAIQITAGGLFPPLAAVLINGIGLVIDITLPYWVGRFSSDEYVDSLIRKYPKFQALVAEQKQNSFFFCFFLRVVYFLPGNVVSLYFGATRTPFVMYLSSTYIGALPYMLLATLMGESIQDVSSPTFWITVGVAVCMSGASMLSYYLYRRHLNKKKTSH